MGAFCCKTYLHSQSFAQDNFTNIPDSTSSSSARSSASSLSKYIVNKVRAISSNSSSNDKTSWMQNYADSLVIEFLQSIQPTVVNEPSNAMQKLQVISSTETGWIVVMNSLIKNVTDDNPFGTALILLSIEEACLASQETISRLHLNLNLYKKRTAIEKRNISIVLGCLAEKLAGTLSILLFSETICDYLLSSIHPSNDSTVILYSLIALEKFSQTRDNKVIICNKLKSMRSNNALLYLEKLSDSNDYVEQQVGFCAKFCLDNHFICEGRPYSYELIDKSGLNAILNSKDASENLKISPDCLTCRNDTSKFESVRSNVPVSSGIYYFEAITVTDGVMQIGFATKSSKFLNHEGYGVGDDDRSLAYDGCRRLIWHNAKSIQTELPRWKPGDIVGCVIDLERREIRFSLNGQMSEPISELFANKQNGTSYYAAVSLMPFQQLSVNLGAQPFKHPPTSSYDFRTFSQDGTLSNTQHLAIPRHLLLKEIDSNDLPLNLCSICYDQKMEAKLSPCEHDGFCLDCADKLGVCPYCRTEIASYIKTTSF